MRYLILPRLWVDNERWGVGNLALVGGGGAMAMWGLKLAVRLREGWTMMWAEADDRIASMASRAAVAGARRERGGGGGDERG